MGLIWIPLLSGAMKVVLTTCSLCSPASTRSLHGIVSPEYTSFHPDLCFMQSPKLFPICLTGTMTNWNKTTILLDLHFCPSQHLRSCQVIWKFRAKATLLRTCQVIWSFRAHLTLLRLCWVIWSLRAQSTLLRSCRVIWHFRAQSTLINDNVKWSRPSCSKLTMSLVNESLKFKSSDTQICWNILLKKCE